jgi:tetratricopeptide (TPR) repeat protein
MLNTGNPDSAGVFIETAYDRMRETGTPNSSDFLKVMKDYANYHAGNKSYEESIKYYEAVIDGYIELGSSGDYRLAKPYNELAFVYKKMEDYSLAEEYFKKSLNLSIQKYGEDHLFTNRVKMNLIDPLFKLQKFDEAESYIVNNIEVLKERFSDQHWRTGNAYGAYGVYFMKMGMYEKADSLFRINLRIFQEAIGPDHIWTAYAEGAVSAANKFLNNHTVADSLYSKHLAVYKDRYPDYNNDHRNQLRRLRLMYMNNDENFEEIIKEYTSLLN